MDTQTQTPSSDPFPSPPPPSYELIGPALEAIASAVIIADPGLTIRHVNAAARGAVIKS